MFEGGGGGGSGNVGCSCRHCWIDARLGLSSNGHVKSCGASVSSTLHFPGTGLTPSATTSVYCCFVDVGGSRSAARFSTLSAMLKTSCRTQSSATTNGSDASPRCDTRSISRTVTTASEAVHTAPSPPSVGAMDSAGCSPELSSSSSFIGAAARLFVSRLCFVPGATVPAAVMRTRRAPISTLFSSASAPPSFAAASCGSKKAKTRPSSS
mmetsp:Transcript_19862/g.61679  ORF Transcript_19862/g.61679 Transcript_19862/m.61679 type:complete len:210 (-) Transcript_19862:235-864(-)